MAGFSLPGIDSEWRWIRESLVCGESVLDDVIEGVTTTVSKSVLARRSLSVLASTTLALGLLAGLPTGIASATGEEATTSPSTPSSRTPVVPETEPVSAGSVQIASTPRTVTIVPGAGTPQQSGVWEVVNGGVGQCSATSPVVFSLIGTSTPTFTLGTDSISYYLNDQPCSISIEMDTPVNGDQLILQGGTSIARTTGSDVLTLTLKADNIELQSGSSISSTSGRLNTVLWGNIPGTGGGVIDMDGVSITTNGGGLAAAGGDTTTTWEPYPGGANITIPNGTPYSGDPGVWVKNSTITTSGGNLRAVGRTINNTGTDNNVGLYVQGSTISTGAGTQYYYGNYGRDAGTAGYIAGVEVNDSTVSSTTGGITMIGELQSSGNLVDGHGLRIGTQGGSGNTSATGNVSISSTSGDISLTGIQGAGTVSGNSSAVAIIGRYGDDVSISSSAGGDISIQRTGTPPTVAGTVVGVQVQGNAAAGSSVSVAADGVLSVTGTGSGNGADGFGVQIDQATVKATGATTASTVTITGTGSGGTGNNGEGISVTGDSTVNSEAGTTTLVGQRGSGDFSEGIAVMTGDNTLGSPSQTGNITLRADKLYFTATQTFYTSGTVTIEPRSASFAEALHSSILGQSDFSSAGGLIIGKSSNTADVTIGGATTVAGPVTVYGGDITVDAAVNTSTGGASGDVLLKASGSISVAASDSITTAGGDITLWADSDDNSAGAISMAGGSSLATGSGGGDITLGGGSAPTSDAAVGDIGISMTDADIDAGAGAVSLRGTSSLTGAPNGRGVLLTSGSEILGATVAITGEGSATNTDNDGNHGVAVAGSTISSFAAGGLSITGTGGGSGTSTNNEGISVTGGSALNSGLGALTLTGVRGVGGTSEDMAIEGGNNFLGDDTQSGDVTLRADVLYFTGTQTVNTSGTVAIEPRSASFTGPLSSTIRSLDYTGRVTGLTIGKVGNASSVTLDDTTTIGGPITIYSDTIAINEALQATNSTITFQGETPGDLDGTVSMSGGSIAADELLLRNIHSTALSSGGTVSIDTLAAIGGHRLLLINDQALEIGSVSGVNGISDYTEWVVIDTTMGDLTVAQPVGTSGSSGSYRLRLRAGTSSAFGTPTGGDVKITYAGPGDVFNVPNAVTQVFSGTQAASTGLSSVATAEAVSTEAPTVSPGDVAVAYRAGPPVITSPTSMAFDDTLTLVALDPSGGTVNFTKVNSGDPCTLVGSTITPTGVGTCVVRATGSPSGLSVDDTITIVKAMQSLAFTSTPPTQIVTGTTYTPTAIATSGLAPVIDITAGSPSVCTLSGGVVTFASAGDCTIRARQLGSDDYLAAPEVTQTLVAGKINQSITFPQPADRGLTAPSFAVGATVDTGRVVTYSTSTPAVCSVGTTSGVISLLSVGNCTITAASSGDASYAAAPDVTRTFAITAVAPGKSSLTSASFDDSAITIGFVAPGFDGGAPITGYQAVATPTAGGTPTTQLCSVVSPCTIGGLVNGTEYTVTLAAINSAGIGPISDPSPAITPATAPDAVTALTTAPGDQQLTVTWNQPQSFGGGTFERYEIFLRVSGTSWPVSPDDSISTVATESATLTGLVNGTAYDIKIVVISSVNSTELASNTTTALGVPMTVPGAPTGLTLTALTSSTVLASWTTPVDDGGTPITGYTLNPACTPAAPTDTSCVITGLTSGSTVNVSVTADNLIGSSLATQQSITLLGDDATLSSLTLSPSADLTPSFAPNQTTYSTAVGNDVASITITPTASDPAATITVNDDTVASGAASSPISLDVGANSIRVFVTATDPAFTKSYNLTVFRGTPPTPVGPGAPQGVRAWAKNAAATVTWLPPTSEGSFPVSTYRATSNPGGATCLAMAPQLTCEVTGLRNGTTYTFTVTALTGAGWGEASSPSNPVTPTADPEPGPTPGPQPVPGPVAPGDVVIDLDGGPAPGATGGPNAGLDGITVTGPSFGLEVATLTAGGVREPLLASGELQARVTGRISVSGDGAIPGSTTAVYGIPTQVASTARAVTEPVLIGTVVVGDSGSYAGSWPVPSALPVGDYLLQVVATPAEGGVLSASTPLRVLPDDERTIVITGSRAGDGAGRRVFARGTTTNLDGATVQARVKLAGEARYRSGSTRTIVDEAFTWTRIANRKVYVYFQTTTDAGEKIRSTSMTIPDRTR